MAKMLSFSRTTRNTRRVFYRPRVYHIMKRIVTRETNNHQIINRVIKGVSILMMNEFMFEKFSSQYSFHNPSVFIYPFSTIPHLDYPIYKTTAIMKALGKQGFSPWMLHPLNRQGYSVPPFGFIKRFFKTFLALPGIMIGLSSFPRIWNNWFSTKTAGFFERFSHNNNYMPDISKNQENNLVEIYYVPC